MEVLTAIITAFVSILGTGGAVKLYQLYVKNRAKTPAQNVNDGWQELFAESEKQKKRLIADAEKQNRRAEEKVKKLEEALADAQEKMLALKIEVFQLKIKNSLEGKGDQCTPNES